MRGEAAFKFLVIEICELDKIDEREEYWLTYHDETILNASRSASGGLPRRER